MKKKLLILSLFIVLIVGVILYMNIKENHMFVLNNEAGTNVKAEEIQPVLGTIKVTGDTDTDVVFTDVETNESYMVGYITHGVVEKIKLEKGKWYRVEGRGNITVYWVNVRIE